MVMEEMLEIYEMGRYETVADTAGFILIVPQGYKDHRGLHIGMLVHGLLGVQ